MRHRRRTLGMAGVVVAVLVISFLPMAAAQDPQADPHHGAEPDAAPQEGTGVPSFNEAENCGAPGTSNPLATRKGWLADSEAVRGYKGDFFGRSIGDIRSRLVRWVVPMSGGNTILVHSRALPAFNRVTANLAAEAQQGRFYQVRLTTGAGNQTWGYAARTVGGSYSISHHALGTTIDINAPANPYRSDGVLVTDMPAWFVNAWKSAGFCWGGDWVGVKDAMHFSWKGPNFTPGYGAVPDPYPPKTAATGFGRATIDYDMPFGGLVPDQPYTVTDFTGNGLPDVVGVVEDSRGIVIDYSRTNRIHAECAVAQVKLPGVWRNGRTVLFGDREGLGGKDLWLLDTSGQYLGIEVALRSTGYRTRTTIPTAIPNSANDGHILGDYDRDGRVDLYVVRRGATATRVQVYGGAGGFTNQVADVVTTLGDTRGSHLALGDRDVDGRPDLYVARGADLRILAHGYQTVTERLTVPALEGNLADLGIGDFDGDGRDDLFLLRPRGNLAIRLGNVPVTGQSLTSWFVAADWTCTDSGSAYNGLFRDDEGNVHEADIDFIADLGITKGCNPPINDRYCPDAAITRGQMAAFLVRALALPPADGDRFDDDTGSIFEDAINRLASAGVTKGCNPPQNTRFCPDLSVTRGQMAAFLVRGLSLTDGAGSNRFVDDDDSVFERDIDILASSGVTKGCNPPANTQYCPARSVTRAQMASFLARALRMAG